MVLRPADAPLSLLDQSRSLLIPTLARAFPTPVCILGALHVIICFKDWHCNALVLFDMMAFYRFPLEVEGSAEPSSTSQVHDQIPQSLLHLRKFDYTWLVVHIFLHKSGS